jgi:hypothetical protein
MRTLLVTLLLGAALACGSSTPTAEPNDDEPQPRRVSTNGEVTLRRGELASVDEGSLLITFLAVTNDSRCPADVVCVWEGDAWMTFRIENPRSEAPFTGEDTLRLNREPRFVLRWGYRVEVKALAPYPYSNDAPGSRDYQVTLAVTRAVD